MDESAASHLHAFENDLGELRRLREACRRPRHWPSFGDPWIANAARWSLAITPLTASWLLREAPYLALGDWDEDLLLRFPLLASTGVTLWILLRAARMNRGGRTSVLVQVGLSIGVAVLGLGPAILSCRLLLEMILAIPLMTVFGSIEQLLQLPSSLFFLLAVASPVGVTSFCAFDAIRLARGIRVAPLSWRDCAWILAGIALFLPAGVGMQLAWIFAQAV